MGRHPRRPAEPKGRIIRLSNPSGEGIVLERVIWGRKVEFEIPEHGYVSLPEAAIILDCSERRIYRLMDRGELRDFRKGKAPGSGSRGSGRSYFRLSDLKKLNTKSEGKRG